MWQLIFDQAVFGNKLSSALASRFRRLAVGWCDPIVQYDLNGRRIALPFSHELPFYQRDLPTYSANLARLAASIRRHFGRLSMIDVGANIGDSYCLAGVEAGDQFLLIEGDPFYFELLCRNTNGSGSVTCVQRLVSDKPGYSSGALVLDKGTARVTGDNGQRVMYSTLDEIVETNPAFWATNLLKTDVDGYDAKVLRASRKLIELSKPVLFFEHYPTLLREAGEDILSIFGQLASWGYPRLIFYDNRGYLIGVVESADERRLNDLLSYVEQQDSSYYDICCFHETQAVAMEEFVQSERAYYRQLASSRR